MPVPLRQLTPSGYLLFQLPELNKPDRSLDIGHPEVEADLGVVLDHRLPTAVPVSSADIHAMFAQSADPGGYRVVGGREHASLAGGKELARVE